MKTFRKTLGFVVLAIVLAVAVASVFAPKSTSALTFPEHDRSAVVVEHDRN